MAKTITRSEHKHKVKKLKKAVWQYLLDHSSKDCNLESFKVILVLKDENYFWHKVKVREKGFYTRKDIKEEKRKLNEMIQNSRNQKMYHKIRNKQIENFNNSRSLLDIVVKILLKKLIKYRERQLKKY